MNRLFAARRSAKQPLPDDLIDRPHHGADSQSFERGDLSAQRVLYAPPRPLLEARSGIRLDVIDRPRPAASPHSAEKIPYRYRTAEQRPGIAVGLIAKVEAALHLLGGLAKALLEHVELRSHRRVGIVDPPARLFDFVFDIVGHCVLLARHPT